MEDPNKLDIPDISAQLRAPYAVAEKPAFAPPQEAPFGLPGVTTWNIGGAPVLEFGHPDGWRAVEPEVPTWFPVEREHLAPEAPMLKETRILAALEHEGSDGQPWLVQLRKFERPLAEVVMQNPANWARGKSSWCEFLGAIQRGVAGRAATILRFAYTRHDTLFVLYEAWLVHGGGGYHFVATAPAADEPESWMHWEAMLASARAGEEVLQAPSAASVPFTPPGPPVPRYRCAARTQVPVTLGNVTSRNPSTTIIAGSPSQAAWSLMGVAAMRLYGSIRANQLEGKTVSVPASGEAVLTDDLLLLRLVVAAKSGRTFIRGGPSDRSVDLDIPYRIIRRVGSDQNGIWLDLVGRGALWLHPRDGGEFARWLAHLSRGKTWQEPVRVSMQPEVPVVAWLQQDPRYTFGLPAEWAPVPAENLAGYGQLFQPSILRAGVGLVAGEYEAQVFVIEQGPVAAVGGRTDEESLAAMLAEATHIAPNGPIEVTTLDGEPLALLRGYSRNEQGAVDRCYGAITHAGTLYALWYTVVGGTAGDGSYEAWAPHFRTMLATWHWYS
jgi:hypothetical protein